MSSLKSIIQKGRWFITDTEVPQCQMLRDETLKFLNHRDTILVNAQSVWDDLFLTGVVNEIFRVTFAKIPRPKPPYAAMWLEAIFGYGKGERQRAGVFTQRFSDMERGYLDNTILSSPERECLRESNATTAVHCCFYHEYEGMAAIDGSTIYWLDPEGQCAHMVTQNALDVRGHANEDELKKLQTLAAAQRQAWLMHTFARLNCHNVRLVEAPNGTKPKLRQQNEHPPFSVWHTIEVSQAPMIRTVGQTESSEEDVRHVRFHWVRGHYADYTKGVGLFGNPKLRTVFWITEHRAGKEELGTVVSDYAVQ